MSKKAVTMDFEKFTFPFMENNYDEYDIYEVVENMQNDLPAEAIELGLINDEVDNWCSWKIEDYYYLLPWKSKPFNWALIRISWDDNWGRYQRESCGRISGKSHYQEPTRILLRALFEDEYGFDLNDPDRAGYREFVENCGN